mgnify:CR=1 FL=1
MHALICADTLYSPEAEDAEHARLHPGCRPVRVFMQEIGTSRNLLAVQIAAPIEMQPACSLLTSDDQRVALPGILLIACIAENAVHIGEPMRSMGCCSSMSNSALFLWALTLKSYGLPVSSSTVISKASPGCKPYFGRRPAAAVTRGGEYTSAIIARAALACSLR